MVGDLFFLFWVLGFIEITHAVERAIMSGNDLSRTPISEDDKAAFLSHYRDTANFPESAKAAGRSLRALRNHKKSDSEFAAECEAARKEAIGKLQNTLWHRAFNGEEEPILYQGQVVAYKKKFDNRLGEFLLERMAPDEFGRRDKTELTGKGGSPLFQQIDDIEIARRIAFALTKATSKKPEIVPEKEEPRQEPVVH